VKQDELFALMTELEDDMVEEAALPQRKRRRLWPLLLGSAACLVLVILGLSLFHQGEPVPRSEGVTIQQIENAPCPTGKNELIYLTEEELFTHFDTAIFRGTVTGIQNIRLSFNGDNVYRALATIHVEAVFRGNCTPGDTVSVLLPCPVSNGVWVEDTEVISRLQEGMTGIFMPIIYREDSCWEQNGAKLYLQEVAPYGFADGMRYAFLKTDAGVMFARHAYPSMENARTLDEIEAYILAMLDKLS